MPYQSVQLIKKKPHETTLNISSLALSTSLFVGLSSVSADTLALAQPEVSGTIDLESDADGNAPKKSLYLRIDAGVNLAQDARVKNMVTNDINGLLSTTDLKIAFETGFEFNIGIGIPLGDSDAWSLEVMTGLAYNSVESVSGEYDTDLFGFVVQGPMTGGNGDLYQVPIVANLRYEFELSECLTLGLYAGGGVQYTNLGINGVQVLDPAFPGGAVDDVGLSSFNGWPFDIRPAWI